MCSLETGAICDWAAARPNAGAYGTDFAPTEISRCPQTKSKSVVRVVHCIRNYKSVCRFALCPAIAAVAMWGKVQGAVN